MLFGPSVSPLLHLPSVPPHIMSSPFDYTEHPHRRYDPLAGTWVLCSPHRAKRPWQGSVEALPPDNRPRYDPNDYLGPGNPRAGGKAHNPKYTDTFVFDNDYMALLPDRPEGTVGNVEKGDLLCAKAVRGRCRVVCFSPRMDVTVAEMSVPELRKVVDTWVEEYEMLGRESYINHVQIFENKGEMMGCSNPHPHGQIWASEFIPQHAERELRNLKEYKAKKGSDMLMDYIELEQRVKQSIVCETNSFLAVVPFWATWPFEILVIAKKKVASFKGFDEEMKNDLADIYRRVTCCYDNLFKTLFPYSMGIHQAPCDGEEHDEAHFHMHFFPPLLRSATVRKFMVGFEMLGEPQRDLTAEQAAKRLAACSETHFNAERKKEKNDK